MYKYKISVIVPFFNRIPLLLEAIESVLQQTYENFELILVDDGSTDNIDEVIVLSEREQRIRLLRQDNQGAAAARNYGIREAAGDYIAFLDSDDLFLPDKLQKQIEFMVSGKYDVSHTSYYVVDMEKRYRRTVDSGYQSGYLFPELLGHCEIATPTVMAKRSVLTQFEEPFPVNFRIGEDICLWIELAFRYKIGGIKYPLTSVRVGETSAVHSKEKLRIGLFNILTYINANPLYSQNTEDIARLIRSLYQQYKPDADAQNKKAGKREHDNDLSLLSRNEMSILQRTKKILSVVRRDGCWKTFRRFVSEVMPRR